MSQYLINRWIEEEAQGKRFPVDFEIAWKVAGYSEKGKGKRRLTSKASHLVEGEDYKIIKGDIARSGKSGLCGRFSDSITMSCDAFKHFCLLAETHEGRQIRQYFIEAEKKWKLVEKHHPEVASEIEIMRIKIELVNAERDAAIAAKESAMAQQKLLDTRHYITTALPEPVQQKILGYTEIVKEVVKEKVYRNNELIRDGSTITKTELCHRYGYVTKSGAPDYRTLNQYLSIAGVGVGFDKDGNNPYWTQTHQIRTGDEFKREHLAYLDRLLCSDRVGYQIHLGETP